MDRPWKAICRAEDQDLWLAVDEAGMPFFRRDGRWEVYDFNALHQGYFVPCGFTLAARAGGLFYLAGLDASGKPHVFSSLLGGVWEERNLTAHRPVEGDLRASGEVLRILYDETERQTFLVCKNGELVTLPDCPKCVRILNLGRSDVADGALEDGHIRIRFADGSERRVSVGKAAQYRVSESFALAQVAQGAAIADLRDPGEFACGHLPGAVNVPLEDLDLWLESRSPEQTLIFVCRTGIHADQAVKFARRKGFTRSFSLGGMLDAARVR